VAEDILPPGRGVDGSRVNESFIAWPEFTSPSAGLEARLHVSQGGGRYDGNSLRLV